MSELTNTGALSATPLRTSGALQLALLTVVIGAAVYSRNELNPIQEALRVNLGLSDNQMGWLQGPVTGVPAAIAAMPVGVLLARYSRKGLLLWSMVLIFAATLAAALSHSLVVLFVSRALVGAALVAVSVAVYAAVADQFPAAARGRANMVIMLGELAGAPAVFALGGALLSLAGSGAAGWRTAVQWMNAPILLVILAMLALREPPRNEVVSASPGLRRISQELWRYRTAIGPILVARILMVIAIVGVLVWAAPSLSRRFALPPAKVGATLATVLLVSGALGPILGGPIADFCQRRGGPRLTMWALAAMALLAIPAGLFALAPSPVAAGVALTAFLTLACTNGVVAITLGGIVIPGELRSLFFAAIFATAEIFGAAAPLIVSELPELLGRRVTIGASLAIVCCVMSTIAAVVFAWGGRYFVSSCRT